MKTRIYLTVIVGLFASSFASGQTLQKLLSSDNQNLIEQATKGCFWLVRQEFQLQEPCGGRKYNLDSLSYFGYAESIAIQTESGLIISKSIREPWTSDSNIADYPGYNPVLSSFSVYDAKNKRWKESTFSPTDSVLEISSSERMFITDSLYIGHGFEVDSLYGEKDGWILWVRKVGEDISITPLKQKITIRDTSSVNPAVYLHGKEAYEFGVFVIPVYTVPCSVKFKISAIVELSPNGWKAIPLICNKKRNVEGHKLVEADKQSQTKDAVRPPLSPVRKRHK